MTFRPFLLVAAFLMAACDAPVAGHPAEAAAGLGGIQPAVETEAALAAILASCNDCRSPEALAGYLESRFAGCAVVERVVSTASDCPGMGAAGVKVSLNRCGLGLREPVDVSRFLVAVGEPDDWRFELVGLKSGVFGADSCGRISGSGRDRKLEFDVLATGPSVVVAGVRIAETLQIDEDGITQRAGGGSIEIRSHSGAGYVFDFKSQNLMRRKGESYPFGGTLTFKDDVGDSTLTFLDTTPATGEVMYKGGDGSELRIQLGM